MCHNESVLLPHTIHHYRNKFPKCYITICDNESTDDSQTISKLLGCNVIEFSSGDILEEFILTKQKNTCWKDVTSGWIIMADMDEWLDISYKELYSELENGTTILDIKGYNIIGNSNLSDISDIDIHSLNTGIYHPSENKNLCFLREKIIDMNYDLGAHSSNPVGTIKYSNRIYINKHMSILGIQYFKDKMIARHSRTSKMRSIGIDNHYICDIPSIEKEYYNAVSCASIIPELTSN